MLCLFMQPANLTCYISTWKHNQVLQILRVMRCWARFFFLFLKGRWCWDRWMAIPPLQQHKKNGTKCCISWPEWKHDKVSCRVAHPTQSPLLAVLHHALYFTYRQNYDHTSRQKTKTTPIIHDTSDHATIPWINYWTRNGMHQSANPPYTPPTRAGRDYHNMIMIHHNAGE